MYWFRLCTDLYKHYLKIGVYSIKNSISSSISGPVLWSTVHAIPVQCEPVRIPTDRKVALLWIVVFNRQFSNQNILDFIGKVEYSEYSGVYPTVYTDVRNILIFSVYIFISVFFEYSVQYTVYTISIGSLWPQRVRVLRCSGVKETSFFWQYFFWKLRQFMIDYGCLRTVFNSAVIGIWK